MTSDKVMTIVGAGTEVMVRLPYKHRDEKQEGQNTEKGVKMAA